MTHFCYGHVKVNGYGQIKDDTLPRTSKPPRLDHKLVSVTSGPHCAHKCDYVYATCDAVAGHLLVQKGRATKRWRMLRRIRNVVCVGIKYTARCQLGFICGTRGICELYCLLQVRFKDSGVRAWPPASLRFTARVRLKYLFLCGSRFASTTKA